jgi:probable rRNA maturation factor
MTDFHLDIQFEEDFTGLVAEALLNRAVKQTLAACGVESPVELGLVIAGDDMVHALNKKYRGIDDTTDVLAFALEEAPDDNNDSFILPPDDTSHLGEVIISYPKSVRQAGEQGHPVEREMALLVVHGVLHLLGYDHDHPEAEQRMKVVEAKVLSTIEDI